MFWSGMVLIAVPFRRALHWALAVPTMPLATTLVECGTGAPPVIRGDGRSLHGRGAHATSDEPDSRRGQIHVKPIRNRPHPPPLAHRHDRVGDCPDRVRLAP